MSKDYQVVKEMMGDYGIYGKRADKLISLTKPSFQDNSNTNETKKLTPEEIKALKEAKDKAIKNNQIVRK